MRTALVKFARRLLRLAYRLAPEFLKGIYREFSRELPLVDRSQVIVYTDDPALFPGYPRRCPLTPPAGQALNPVKISLISTVRNEAGSARDWLASLLAQSRLPDEVVVVDGGSTDGTPEILRDLAASFPIPLRIIEAPGANIARGRNVAIQAAAHPFIACADFHSTLDVRWLERLARPFELDDRVQLSAGYSAIAGSGRLARMAAHYFGVRLDRLDPQEFLPSSRSIAMRKSFWQQAGGYPEWLTDAGEDTLFDYQAKSQPSRWAFAPEAQVAWRAPDSAGKLLRKYFRYARGDGETGIMARRYWYKTLEAIWMVLILGVVLALLALAFLWFGSRAWLAVLGLGGVSAWLSVRENRRRAAERGVPFGPYTLLDHVLGFTQVAGYIAGVAGRRRAHQRQVEFYRAQLGEILAAHPGRKGPIVYLPTHDWGFMFQRPQQMARALARRGFLYFYCTANERSDAVYGFRQVEPGLYLAHVPVETFSALERPIVVIGSPWNCSLLGAFQRPRVIYDHYDELEVSGGREEDHRSLLAAACTVLVSSQELLEKIRPSRPDAVFAPNAVDWGHIQRFRPAPGAPPPADLAPILERGRPLAGYSGALAEWFDYDLLARLAAARPQVEFILLGVDYDGSLGRSGALDLENVHWLGLKPYDDLFPYLWRFHLGLIPFKINAITRSTSPIKLFEYMACGLPVVAAPLPECLRYPEVLVAESAEQFASRLDEALRLKENPNYVAAITRLAQANTWDSRAQAVEAALERGKGG